MQTSLDFYPPPPPPAFPTPVTASWSADPAFGPPSWPPFPPPRQASRWNRPVLASVAILSLATGATSAWFFTSKALTPPPAASISTGPAGNPNIPNAFPTFPSISFPALPSPLTPATHLTPVSPAIVKSVDAAIVDITGQDATGSSGVAGTGMLLTSNGDVLTNNHVIDGIIHLTAQVDGKGKLYPATVIGYDPLNDVALLHLTGAKNLPTVPLGNSDTLSAGATLTVLGNALGKGGTPAETVAQVQALNQSVTASDPGIGAETLTGMIQILGNIQPGDSGGPELNAAGQVIGMTTAGSADSTLPSTTPATTGYAIPINKALSEITAIRTDSGPSIHLGKAAFLGVTISNSPASGATISAVTPKTPAARAGLAAGDIIVQLGNATITSPADLHTAMAAASPGQTLTIVWTDPAGTTHQHSLTLGTAPFSD